MEIFLLVQRERNFNVCVYDKNLFGQDSKDSNVSDCNQTRTQNHLVRKRTLNQFSAYSPWDLTDFEPIFLVFRGQIGLELKTVVRDRRNQRMSDR